MSVIDDISKKNVLEMTNLEYAVWNLHTTEAGNIGELAAEELHALQARIAELEAGFKSIGITPADEDLQEMNSGKWFYLTDSGEELVDSLDEAISKTMNFFAEQSQ